MAKEFTVRCRSTFSCNDDQNWRHYIGAVLRRLATKIDGRQLLAIEYSSSPSLPPAVQRECIMFGLLMMARSLRGEVHAQGVEKLLRAAHPELFENADG